MYEYISILFIVMRIVIDVIKYFVFHLFFMCAAAGMNAIMVGQILAYGNQKSGITQKNKKDA